MKPVLRGMQAVLWLCLCAFNTAHSADSDGSSSASHGFLTIVMEILDGHPAYRSYDVTPAAKQAFTTTCKGHHLIWINNRAIQCLGTQAIEHTQALWVMVADRPEPPSGQFYLVSTHPTPYFAMRRLRDQEPTKVLGALDGSERKGGAPRLSAHDATRWRAVDDKGVTLVLVPLAKDKDGNEPTRVFSLSDSGAAYVGQLPGWPESLMAAGDDGWPVAMINEDGEAFAIVAYTIFPKVGFLMYVGEGG